jgi:hypothetical protein
VPSSLIRHSPGGSTGVTTARDQAKRVPSYWYESRRRYFQKNFGLRRAVAADLAFVGARTLGILKRTLTGERNLNVPHQIRDVIAHSPLWKKNRTLAVTNNFRPTKANDR